MARESDPTQNNSSLYTGRFNVWNELSDEYRHTELANNWDLLDAMFGRMPSGVGYGPNTAWPPSVGIGGGLYAQINLLMQARSPIGEVIDWWYPFSGSETETDITNLVNQHAPGFAICDGRKVTDHDFSNPSDTVSAPSEFYAPDLRNQFIIGASATNAPGTATLDPGVAVANDSSLAPGVVRTQPASGAYAAIGIAGSNMQASIPINIPDHFHRHSHTHFYGGIATGGFDTIQDTNERATATGAVAKSSGILNLRTHEHAVRRASTSLPKGPESHDLYLSGASPVPPSGKMIPPIPETDTSPSIDRSQTSLQIISQQLDPTHHDMAVDADDPRNAPTASGSKIPGTVVDNFGQDLATSSSLSGSFNLDKRPQHVGMLKLMRVKYPTLVQAERKNHSGVNVLDPNPT